MKQGSNPVDHLHTHSFVRDKAFKRDNAIRALYPLVMSIYILAVRAESMSASEGKL